MRHVIADAAYDADPPRAFIANDLGATAQIKANPSRTSKPPIDWRLYKERHQVECFFNKLKRFRRIAPRCEKTLPAFMGFVHLARARSGSDKCRQNLRRRPGPWSERDRSGRDRAAP